MNRKQFLILLALVVVIGAAGLFVYRGGNNSWHGGAVLGQKLLPNFSVNDVAQITIKSGAGEVNLARRDNLWRVHERADYPANFQQISELLLKLADLKVVQNVDVGPSQLGRMELLPPGSGEGTGTSIEFKDQSGKSLGSVLLGKMHMKKPSANSQPGGMGDESFPDGRYVLTVDKAVAVISDPLDNVQPKPEQWLSKDFLNIEKPRLIAVQFPEATNSWKLTRASETNDWQLANARAGEKLDSSKISSVTSPFTSVNFTDVGVLSTGNAASNTVMTVDTFDGFSYTAKIGPKQDDNYTVSFTVTTKDLQTQQKALADKLAKESALTNWTYQLPAYTVDEMLKTRQQLLEEVSTNSTAQAQK